MIWNYIKADSFFKDYLPNIKSYKHKIRGKNGRGNPVSFTEEEKKQIQKGLSRLFNDIKASNAFTQKPFSSPGPVKGLQS